LGLGSAFILGRFPTGGALGILPAEFFSNRLQA
jgi:hypothetical protein